MNDAYGTTSFQALPGSVRFFDVSAQMVHGNRVWYLFDDGYASIPNPKRGTYTDRLHLTIARGSVNGPPSTIVMSALAAVNLIIEDGLTLQQVEAAFIHLSDVVIPGVLFGGHLVNFRVRPDVSYTYDVLDIYGDSTAML